MPTSAGFGARSHPTSRAMSSGSSSAPAAARRSAARRRSRRSETDDDGAVASTVECVIDGIFVFDNAIHCSDMSDANLRAGRSDARYSRDLLLALGAGGRWAGYNDGSIEFKKR